MATSWHSVLSAKFHSMQTVKFAVYSTAVLSVAACAFYFLFVFERQESLVDYANRSFSRDLEIVHIGLRIKRAMVEHDALLFRYLHTRDPFWLVDLDALEQTVRENVAALRSHVRTSYMNVRLDSLEKSAESYFSISTQIRKQRQERLFNIGQNHIKAAFTLCDEFISIGRVEAERSQQTLASQLHHTRRLAIALGLLLGFSLLGLAIRLAVMMLGPLNDLMEGVRRFKEGERDVYVPIIRHDELGRLADAFNAMVGTISDQKERLLQETITDGLTGVYNQRYFQEMIVKECDRSRRSQEPLSLLMIDLDYFKEFNDRQGHEMGNELLRRLTSAIGDQLRSTDILARYGGDEFSILLVNATSVQAQSIAQKIQDTVAKGRFPGVRSLPAGRASLSIGGATMPDNAQTAEDLILKADEALYAAKAAGRSCIRWAGVAGFDRKGNSLLDVSAPSSKGETAG